MSIVSRAFESSGQGPSALRTNGALDSEASGKYRTPTNLASPIFRAVIDWEGAMPPFVAENHIAAWAGPWRLPSGPVTADPRRVSAAVGHGCIAFAWGECLATDSAAAQSEPAERALAAYVEHPEDWLLRLSQAFAIVVIDYRRKKVAAAVDRLGRETLCYQVDRGALVVSDRADYCATGRNDLSLQALYHFLYFHVIPSSLTAFQGVTRLAPGFQVEFERGQCTESRFWTPQFVEWGEASFAPLKEEFLALVQQAVARRVPQHDRYGCFLSGGTDSSTVAGMLARVTGLAPKTFSIGFDAAGYDEMEYARIASQAFSTEQNEYYVTPDDVYDDLPRLAAFYDQPFGNSSALAGFHCARLARENGVSAMLAGDGGDELFGGNTRYAEQQMFLHYQKVPAWMRSYLLEPIFLNRPWMKQVPGLRQAAGYVRYAKMPMPGRMEAFNLLNWLGPENLMTGSWLDAINLEGPHELQNEVYQAAQGQNQINRMTAYDWRFTLADNDLPKVNGTTRMAGVEVSYPWLDDDLLDFALKLPPSFKVKGNKLRWFFKESLRGFLPDAILTKKKHGFGLPFGPWLANHDGLKRLADDAIVSLADSGLIHGDYARHILRERLQEHPGYYGTMIWVLVILAQWLESHQRWRSVKL